MVNLTFGEQVKIILSRKGMTIKELAERIEMQTGKKMSRQNMTQRLGRDNFQEQDMRMIAEILGCPFQLSIMGQSEEMETEPVMKPESLENTVQVQSGQDTRKRLEQKSELKQEELSSIERDVTIGELVQMEKKIEEPVQKRVSLTNGFRGFVKKPRANTPSPEENGPILGEVNPYTGKEYQTNSVRMHPKRIGYVQVYDQEQHKWTDMTEWAFLGYQERKKALLGKDYEPPIYLD